MSGVNISGQILFVFMVLLNTICTAGGIFMSQYYGAGDKRGMCQALSFKAVLAAAAIVLYLLVCMVFPRQILSLMVVGNSQADAILDEAVKYMFLMGFNGIPMAISTICSSSLARDRPGAYAALHLRYRHARQHVFQLGADLRQSRRAAA